jgi:heme/copper-type cytochrome/quinol oxidase subunit 4
MLYFARMLDGSGDAIEWITAITAVIFVVVVLVVGRWFWR